MPLEVPTIIAPDVVSVMACRLPTRSRIAYVFGGAGFKRQMRLSAAAHKAPLLCSYRLPITVPRLPSPPWHSSLPARIEHSNAAVDADAPTHKVPSRPSWSAAI